MEIREVQKETARQMQETDRRMQETDRQMQETARRMQETDRKISRLGNRIGDLIEHLTASNILEQFRELGYQFTRVSRRNEIKDPGNRILAEIDLLLENGDSAMVVEVKSLLALADVKDHIKRMGTIRRYADFHHDARKYLGAVSGALIEEDAKNFALQSGFYVIEHPGETTRIIPPREARAW
jgi:hypothetical protein